MEPSSFSQASLGQKPLFVGNASALQGILLDLMLPYRSATKTKTFGCPLYLNLILKLAGSNYLMEHMLE